MIILEKYAPIKEAIKQIEDARENKRLEILKNFYKNNVNEISLWECETLHDNDYYYLHMDALSGELEECSKDLINNIFKDKSIKQFIDMFDSLGNKWTGHLLSHIELEEWDIYRKYHKSQINLFYEWDWNNLCTYIKENYPNKKDIADFLKGLQKKDLSIDLSGILYNNSDISEITNKNGKYVASISESFKEDIYEILADIVEDIEEVINDYISSQMRAIEDYYMSDNYIFEELFERDWLSSQDILDMFIEYSNIDTNELQQKYHAI